MHSSIVSKRIQLLFLGFVFAFSSDAQNPHFLDIGFGDWKQLVFAYEAIEYIEREHYDFVFNYLSSDAEIGWDSIASYNKFIVSIREDDNSYPSTLIDSKYEGDTLYYERHYYRAEKNKPLYVAQLVVTMNKRGEILDIKLYNEGEFINRDKELIAMITENYQAAYFSRLPTNKAKMKKQ